MGFKKICLSLVLLAGCASQSTRPLAYLGGRGVASTGGDPDVVFCQNPKEYLPEGWRSGSVMVPEDWRDKNSRKIKITYYTDYQAGVAGQPRPVLFFNGGPAQSSYPQVSLFERSAGGGSLFSRKFTPYILFDQRGTGCSDKFPDRQAADFGKQINLYGSRAIAQDADLVLGAILPPGQKVTVFGHSYGGLIAFRMLELHPERLDLVATYGTPLALGIANFPRALVEARAKEVDFLLSDKASLGEIRSKLQELRASLSPTDCVQSSELQLCGPSLVDTITFTDIPWKNYWGELSEFLRNMRGKKDFIARVRENFLPSFGHNFAAFAALSKRDLLMGVSIEKACGMPTGESPLASDCGLLKGLQLADPVDLSAVRGDPLRLAEIKNNLRRFPNIRIVVGYGEKDTMGPAALFREDLFKAQFGDHVRMLPLNFQAHDGFLTDPMVNAVEP